MPTLTTINDLNKLASDEKLIVLYYNNNNRPKIVRLNHNGAVDTSFTIGAPTSGDIYDIKLQDDGKCIVAGNFNNYGGQTKRTGEWLANRKQFYI